MDLDLRGSDDASRATFWLGVDRANERYRDWDQEAVFSHEVAVVRRFHAKRDCREAIISEQVPPVDLDELWFDDSGQGASA